MQYQPKWENKTLLHIMMTGIPCVKTFLTNFYQHFKSLMVLPGLVGIIAAEPLKYIKSETIIYFAELAVDGEINSTCSFTTRSLDQRWWQVSFWTLLYFLLFPKSWTFIWKTPLLIVCLALFQVQLRSQASIESVAVTINSDGFQHFTIFVIELLHGNKALYKPCSKFEVI